MAEPTQSQERTELPPETLRRMAEMRVGAKKGKRRPFKPVAYRTTPTELENLFQQSLPEAVAQIPVKEAMEALPPKEEAKPVEFVPAPTPQAIAETEEKGLAKRTAERGELAKRVKGIPGHMLGTTISILESVGGMVDTTPTEDQRKIADRLKRSRKAKARKKALERKEFTLAKVLPKDLTSYKEEDILDAQKEHKLVQAYRAGPPDVSQSFRKGYSEAEHETAKRLKEMHWVERTLGDLGDLILAIPQLTYTATGLAGSPPAETGEAIASGVVGGTAHIFAHPIDSFQSRPWMTLLTWIPALRAAKAGAAASAVGRKASPALAKLKRQSAQVMIDGAKKVGINAPPEVWVKFKRFWFDGMYQRTPHATRFVEDLIKAPQEAQQKVRTKIDELSRDVASGEQRLAERIESDAAREMAVDPAGQISVRPKTEATQVTVQERPGAVTTETKVDVFQEPVKTPVRGEAYEVYDPRTAALIDSIAAEVVDIRGLTPEHLQGGTMTSTGVKNAVRASLAAVLYDNSVAYLARGSRTRTKLIDNMFAKTELGRMSPKAQKQARKQINQIFDNPKLTRAIVAGEDLASGIVPEITFRGEVVFDQLKLQEALRYELRPGGLFPMRRQDFRNKIKAEAVMRVGEQIANQARKGTFKNLIEAELSKTKAEPVGRNIDALRRQAEKESAAVADRTARLAEAERLFGTETTPGKAGVITAAEEALNQAKQKLNETGAQLSEAEAAGTPAQQRVGTSADKFMEEALVGEADAAPHAPLMIEANPTELANHLKATKETWLRANKDAIVSEGVRRGLTEAEAITDAVRNFDDVVNRLDQYKQLPPEVVGTGKPVYADAGVHHTLVWEERARATLEGALLGKGALGFVDWMMSQMKANLTARNLPTHVNNFTANLALQMLRRGDPTIIARQMATLKKWVELRQPKKRRAGVTDAEWRDMQRFNALAESKLLHTDMVQHEIGAALKGKPLQKAYMWGDQIFKLEEAMNVMKKLDSAYGVMQAGDWIELVTSPRRTQTLWKLADGNMSLTKGGKALSIAEIDRLSARAGGHSALKLFFDYSDVPTMVKFLKSSRVLSLASPFYTWFWKAMTTGGKGLIGEVLAGPTTFKTNSRAVNGLQFKELGGVSLRRTMITQGYLGELRNNEDRKSRQKLYKYLPREVATHIVSELQDPTYSEGISVRGMNYAEPQMIVLRGIGSAIVEGGGVFGTYKEDELYPKLGDGSTDYDLRSVPTAQRDDILKRRRLWGKHYRNELMTYDQALQFVGLTGGLAVDILSYIMKGEKDKRTQVDAATLWTQYGKIMVGGLGHAAISDLAAAYRPNQPRNNPTLYVKSARSRTNRRFYELGYGTKLNLPIEKKKS